MSKVVLLIAEKKTSSKHIFPNETLHSNSRFKFNLKEVQHNNEEVSYLIKACDRYFYQTFVFSPNASRSKTVKNVFYCI